MTHVLITGHLLSRAEALKAVTAKGLVNGKASVRTEVFSEQEVAQQLGAGPVVLVYDTAASFVGLALGEATVGHLPRVKDLVNAWCLSAQAMLRLASRFPERCLLVDGAAAAASPDRFLSVASGVLDLQLEQHRAVEVSTTPATADGSAVVRALADATVASHPDAGDLYLDLESFAHLGSDGAAQQAPAFDEAWHDFALLESRRLAAEDQAAANAAEAARITQALEDCRSARSSADRRLESITRERDRHMAAALDAARQTKRIADETTDAAAQADRLHRESLTLLSQLHEAHLESESFFDRAAVLSTQLDALQNEKSQREQNLAASANEVRSLRLEAEHARRQTQQQGADITRLEAAVQRNERLASDAMSGLRQLREFWQSHHPAVVSIDMRKDIAGENWHAAEPDGRWTGPGTVSTLTVPALSAGRYRIELELLGAMGPEIGSGLQLALNDRPLAVVFNRAKHPRIATATLEADGAEGAHPSEWRLMLTVPAVASPADRGSADRRRLGVRVGEVRFIAVAKG